MIVKLLTEHHLEFQSLKVGCTGSYESTLVKMPNFKKKGRINSYNESGPHPLINLDRPQKQNVLLPVTLMTLIIGAYQTFMKPFGI